MGAWEIVLGGAAGLGWLVAVVLMLIRDEEKGDEPWAHH